MLIQGFRWKLSPGLTNLSCQRAIIMFVDDFFSQDEKLESHTEPHTDRNLPLYFN